MKTLAIILLFSVFGVLFAQNNVVFHDDFFDNSLKWPMSENELYENSIADGAMRINHFEKTGNIISRIVYIDFEHKFSAEAGITQLGGVRRNGFGISLGTEERGEFINFLVSTAGMFRIDATDGPNVVEIAPWTKSAVINPIGAPNELRIEHADSIYKYFVNDSIVFSSPAVNFAGKYSYAGFIAFDSMEVAADYISIRQDTSSINLVNNMKYGMDSENLGTNVNTAYLDLKPVISPDGTTLYFVREGHPFNYGDQDIWVSELSGDNWSAAKNAGKPLNNKAPNVLVSITPDENSALIMNQYNEDGTCAGGGFSISHRTIDGWSLPEDVEMINHYNWSPYQEPCLSADGRRIIMNAKREDSFGKQDLYVSFLREDGKWSEPLNLGTGINTPEQESSPFLAADGVTLYFATNGRPGFGMKDIFMARRLDSTWTQWSEPINLGPEINTPSDDAYYTIPASGEYAYIVSSDNSINNSPDIFRIKLNEGARPKPVVIFCGKVINAKTGEPMEAIIHYETLPDGIERGTARSNPITGEFRIALPGGRKYGFRAEADAYLSISDNIDLTELEAYDEICRDLKLVPIEKGAVIRLNNVFFDFDKYFLRDESIPELERVVDFLNDYPEHNIFIRAHTDSRGTDEYNIALSDNRAASVYDYLIERGIDEDRLRSRGFGESMPIATNQTDEGRQLNRRVEFVIE